jgi:hypothetical protein
VKELKGDGGLAAKVVRPRDAAPHLGSSATEHLPGDELGALFDGRSSDLHHAREILARNEDDKSEATVSPSRIAVELVERIAESIRAGPPFALCDKEGVAATRIRMSVLPCLLKASACVWP